MAASGSERVAVELCKGINGLDKVVLRDPRGSTAEVLFTIKTPTFDDFFF
jgi:glucose-6-phosphate 1-epimerase